jgi:protein-S-isoprenylcysteine O-methyltransferase Ste14
MTAPHQKPLGPLLPPHAAVLLLAVSIGLHALLPAAWRHVFACRICGAILAVAGLGLGAWAAMLFRRSGTPVVPTKQPLAFVRRGPYRFTRNPMYLGIALVLLGAAVWFGSPALLLAPVGFVAVMSATFIPYEERRLRATFGDAYAEFTRGVRRWI